MASLILCGCYPKFQLRVYTEVGEDGGASRTLTYLGDPIRPVALPDSPPWKIEKNESSFYKITRYFPDARELKTDIFFPRRYPDASTFSDDDKDLLDDIRLKAMTPETFFAKNQVSIVKRDWFFFTVFRYDESFENRKIVEMLRKVEDIDSVRYKILGKDDRLEEILSSFQFVYELKLPGSLIKTSSKDVSGNYCSWTFSMADFYWGYREYKLQATSIRINYGKIALTGIGTVLFVFALFLWRTRRARRSAA